MRLHGGDVDGRFHLGGIVRIVLIDAHAVGHAGQVEPPVRAGEVRQRLAHAAHGQLGDVGNGDRGQRVQQILLARNGQLDLAQRMPVERHGETRPAQLVVGNILGAQLVVRLKAVGARAAFQRGQHAPNARIVTPAHDPAVLGHKARKAPERRFDVVQILVEIQMILVDVEDHRDRGIEMPEAAAVFAGLGDERIAAAYARAAADRVQLAADVNARILARFDENLRDHRRGGGLAVRAGDADRLIERAHQPPQQHRALNLRNAQPLRLGALGVAFRNGGRIDHQIRAVDVFGAVADVNLYAQLFERFGLVGGVAVGAGHGTALLQHEPRQPAHGAAADSDKMQMLSAHFSRHMTIILSSGDGKSHFFYHYTPCCAAGQPQTD